jgi:GH25 family lysozyme M1 (1,4-beta-N-acetylmuramidase)
MNILQYIKTLIAPPLVMPDTARVWGVDVSHWNPAPVDFQRMKDLYHLDFAIIKGADGTITSRYFRENVASAKASGIPWGMYVWLYPNNKISIAAQVQAWRTLEVELAPPMGVLIDCEWTTFAGAPANPLTADLRMAHDKYFALSTTHATTYTAKGYADTNLKNFDWSREPLWIANYGVTSPALPIGATTYQFWQFTSTLDGWKLDPTGNQKLDGNYFNGTHTEFAAKYGSPSVAIADGYQKVRRYNSDVHIWCGKATIKVTNNSGSLIRPSNFTGDVVINGDGWTPQSPYLPYSLAVSNGTSVQAAQLDFRPFINSKADRSVVISGTDKANAYNLVSGTRYSVKGGVNAFALSSDPEHVTELHPRTAIGYTREGRLIACVVDGRSTISAGVTLYQLANIMLDAGAWWALELDGGDSSIMLVDGIKKSNNGDLINGVRTERATVNSIIFTGANNMAIIGTAKSTTHDLRIRNVHQVSGSTALGTVPMNVAVNVTEIWLAVNTVSGVTNAGDLWALITYGAVTGWVGLKHLSVIYGAYAAAPVITPPPVATLPVLPVSITLGDDVTYAKQTVTVNLQPLK